MSTMCQLLPDALHILGPLTFTKLHEVWFIIQSFIEKTEAFRLEFVYIAANFTTS